MKRVLFVFPQWHFNIAQTLQAISTEYEVHTLHYHSQDEIQQLGDIGIPGIQLHTLRCAGKRWIGDSEVWIPAARDLWEKIAGYDVVVFKNLFTPETLLGALFCRMRGIRFIVTEQKITHPRSVLGRLLYTAVKHIYIKPLLGLRKRTMVALTPKALTQLAEYTRKPRYIPYAYSTGAKKSYHAQDNRIAILNVSKFQERKNQLLLLEALNDVQKKHPQVRFSLTCVGGITKGSDYLQRLRRAVGAVQTKFVTKVPQSRMRALYARADMFVLASHDEPVGFVVLEAMAAGVPVVSSDDAGVSGYVTQAEKPGGKLFVARDRAALADAIEALCIRQGRPDWEKLKRYGVQARRTVEHYHNATAIRAAWHKVLEAA